MFTYALVCFSNRNFSFVINCLKLFYEYFQKLNNPLNFTLRFSTQFTNIHTNTLQVNNFKSRKVTQVNLYFLIR